MLWFHILLFCVLVGSMLSSIGLLIGVLVKVAQGASEKSLENDPLKNGTLVVYTMMIIFQVLLLGASIFGLILCLKTQRNKYQLDKILRNRFTVWLVVWAVTFLGILSVGAYAITWSKDSTSQLADLYEIFKDHLVEPKFIASFLEYQEKNTCCGVYGADDWLVAQLQNSNSGGDLNPTTGKCHLSEDTIPNGCGQDLIIKISATLRLYGILNLVELVFGVGAGVAAAFSFCHWLNHEVMVIPEDEVGDVIIVEPPKGGDSSGKRQYGRSKATVILGPVFGDSSHHTDHMHSKSKKFGQSKRDVYGAGTRHDFTATESHFGEGSHHDHAHGSHLPPGMKSIYRPGDDDCSIGSAESFVQVPSPTPEEVHHNPSTPHHTKSHAPDHDHGATGPKSKKEALLEKEEKAVLKGALGGGKVIGEMHVEHKFDKDGKPMEDPNDKKRATLMIVRNKKVTPPSAPPGHHGQTGHLAEDIAEMSGKNAKTKIEDLVIPDLQGKHHQDHHKEREPVTEKSKKAMFGSVTGDAAQLDIENLINPAHLKAEEAKEMKKQREEADVIKPRYLSLEPQHHHMGGSGGGSTIPVHPLEHHVNSHLHDHEHERYIPEEHHDHHDHDHEHHLHEEQHHEHEHEHGHDVHLPEEHHHPTGHLHDHEHEHHSEHEGHEHGHEHDHEHEHHHPEYDHGHEHQHH